MIPRWRTSPGPEMGGDSPGRGPGPGDPERWPALGLQAGATPGPPRGPGAGLGLRGLSSARQTPSSAPQAGAHEGALAVVGRLGPRYDAPRMGWDGTET